MVLDIRKILVPLDFSVNSELALDYARAMARRFGAALHLVHVCELPAMIAAPAESYGESCTEWNQWRADEAQRQLTELQRLLLDVPSTTEVLFGNPARAIVTAANVERSDMIVMGTHGHSPIMHVLMGNVAERVVRTAPCPVLTVRGPREKVREAEKKPAAAAAAMSAVGVMLALLLAPSPALAQGTDTKQAVAGGELFRTYCVVCHGATARGDGPLASGMSRKPADLTEIAKRNGGSYPAELVIRTIDGKKPVRGHGGPDMPVWGDAFARSRHGGDDASVQRMIQSLSDYLETLQARTVP